MAFPAIASRTNTTTGTTSINVAMPATVNAGDTLIVFIAAKGASGTTTLVTPSGWTLLDATPTGNQNTVGGIYYRKSDGTEGGTSTTFSSSGNAVAMSASCYRITGAADPTVNAPEHSTIATGFTNSATPGTLTPTGGSKDYLWLEFISSVGANATAYSTGFGNGNNFANGTNAEGNVADMQATASSESPSAVSLSASTRWYCWTIAVYPSGGAAPVNSNFLAFM